MAELFERIPGPKREYRNILTGEIVGRRTRDKYYRAGLTNEKLAELNKVTNLDLALSRPARGRASILKKEPTERELILAARKEDLKRRKEIAAEQKELKAIERQIRKQELKKVRRNRVTNAILKGGARGARVSFNTYDEYLKSLKEAKALGTVEGYGLGMVGYDDKSGESRAITVFTMQSIRNRPISEEVFEERFDEEREERLYFVFQHYFMHVAFYESFTRQVEAEWIKAGRPRHTNKTRKTSKKGKRK